MIDYIRLQRAYAYGRPDAALLLEESLREAVTYGSDKYIANAARTLAAAVEAGKAERVREMIRGMDKEVEQLAPSLLYAAAKPSAPAELVQGVKDGDITTHKQYQALLAQLKAKDGELCAQLQAAPATVEVQVIDRDEVERLAARLASLAESVVRGCAALIQTWLTETFDATNDEEADSIAVFNRFAYGLDMALRNGEWPSDEEIELERAGEEPEAGYV